MDLSKLKPEYFDLVYAVSIKFPLCPNEDERVIGYYGDKYLAGRVKDFFYGYFMKRIKGGVNISSGTSEVKIEKISGRWQFVDPEKEIEFSFNEEKIQKCIDSVAKYANSLKMKIINKDGTERFESIFINPKRKAEQPLGKEPKRHKVDHKAALLKLGFAFFQSEEALRRAYKEWALANHPDKKPEAERGEADARFKTMRIHYDAVLEAGQWASQSKDSPDGE
jgi:hypothetical protein